MKVIRKRAEEIRDAIDGRRFSHPMKRALQRVLDGDSDRRAAQAEGVGWRDLYRNAASVGGLREAHLAAWRAGWGAAFPAVWRHHVERLDEAG
jgi:hypothetical protein